MSLMLSSKTLVRGIVLLFLFIPACESSHEREVIEARPQPTNTQKLSPTPAVESSGTSTSAETSTIEPTRTLTIPPITNRHPSNRELEDYLTALSLTDRQLGHVIEAMYEDVNGDGESDLVVSDYLFVGIFIWQGSHYSGSFIYQGYPWKYDPGSRVTLADWTDDDTPEVIFDFRDDTGGTGVHITNWTRYVIHCQNREPACTVIWAGLLGSLTEGYGNGGVSILEADVALVSDGDSTLNLELFTESFAIYSYVDFPSSSPIGDGILSYSSGRVPEGYPSFTPLVSLKVHTSTLDIFSWNGTVFEWQETQIVKPAMYTDSLAVLEATNSEGQTAMITTRSNNDAGLSNDICQLFVGGAATGLPFGCKNNFTEVTWQDIIGDTMPELVITAYSGFYLDTGFEGDHLSADKDCIHQRVLIFQQEGAQLRQIANVTGCVVQSDLYGIRLEDIDEDGQIEILAASGWFTAPACASVVPGPGGQQENCWYEFGYQDEVYKWNGSQFAFAGIQE